MADATVVGTEGRLRLPTLQEDDGFVSTDKILFSLQRIVELAQPVRVLAFGSRARGEHQPESDLDLAVIVDRYSPKSGLPPVTRADLDVWMPVDLVVYDLERERELRECVNTLQFIVEREGVVLYDRAAGFVDRRSIERLV